MTPFSVMGAGGPRGLIYRREPFVRVIIAYMARIDQGRTLTSSRKSRPFVTQGADDLERHGGASDDATGEEFFHARRSPAAGSVNALASSENDLADTPLLLGCHCLAAIRTSSSTERVVLMSASSRINHHASCEQEVGHLRLIPKKDRVIEPICSSPDGLKLSKSHSQICAPPIGRRFESTQQRGHWSKGALCERVTQPRVARTHALVPRTL
jgi:hypothetical protein